MRNIILIVLLVVIVAILFARMLAHVQYRQRPLITGIVLGIIGAVCYNNWSMISSYIHGDILAQVDSKINKSLAACKRYVDRRPSEYSHARPYRTGSKSRYIYTSSDDESASDIELDDELMEKMLKGSKDPQNKKEPDIFEEYGLTRFKRGKYKLHKSAKRKCAEKEVNGKYSPYPTDFHFGGNESEIPDGWSSVRGMRIGTDKYDIDGHLINGNTINPKSGYTDEFWKMNEKLYGEEMYSAADLHMSRKPREAFYYQSRWGVNSLRPWISAELDDHANKIWWEDNPDLDQYM